MEDQYCRLCMSEENLTDMDGLILNCVQNVFSIAIDNDELSNEICRTCKEFVSKIAEFKEKVNKTQKLLQKILKRIVNNSDIDVTNKVMDDIRFDKNLTVKTALPVKKPHKTDETDAIAADSTDTNVITGNHNELISKFIESIDLDEVEKMAEKMESRWNPNCKFCPICKKKTLNLEQFTKHVQTSLHMFKSYVIEKTGDPYIFYNYNVGYSCSVCKKNFTSQTILATHYREDHMLPSNKQILKPNTLILRRDKKNEDEEGHLSEVIVKNEPDSVNANINSMNEQKEHLCKLCKITFTFTESLQNHVRKHHKGIHFCILCNFTSISKTSYSAHLRKHYNLTYKHRVCSTCFEVCDSSSDLMTHRKTIHESKILSVCTICTETFPNLDLLEKHKRDVHRTPVEETPKKMLKCRRCYREFRSLLLLEEHQCTAEPQISPKKSRESCSPVIQRSLTEIDAVSKKHKVDSEENTTNRKMRRLEPTPKNNDNNRNQSTEIRKPVNNSNTASLTSKQNDNDIERSTIQSDKPTRDCPYEQKTSLHFSTSYNTPKMPDQNRYSENSNNPSSPAHAPFKTLATKIFEKWTTSASFPPKQNDIDRSTILSDKPTSYRVLSMSSEKSNSRRDCAYEQKTSLHVSTSYNTPKMPDRNRYPENTNNASSSAHNSFKTPVTKSIEKWTTSTTAASFTPKKNDIDRSTIQSDKRTSNRVSSTSSEKSNSHWDWPYEKKVPSRFHTSYNTHKMPDRNRYPENTNDSSSSALNPFKTPVTTSAEKWTITASFPPKQNDIDRSTTLSDDKTTSNRVSSTSSEKSNSRLHFPYEKKTPSRFSTPYNTHKMPDRNRYPENTNNPSSSAHNNFKTPVTKSGEKWTITASFPRKQNDIDRSTILSDKPTSNGVSSTSPEKSNSHWDCPYEQNAPSCVSTSYNIPKKSDRNRYPENTNNPSSSAHTRNTFKAPVTKSFEKWTTKLPRSQEVINAPEENDQQTIIQNSQSICQICKNPDMHLFCNPCSRCFRNNKVQYLNHMKMRRHSTGK